MPIFQVEVVKKNTAFFDVDADNKNMAIKQIEQSLLDDDIEVDETDCVQYEFIATNCSKNLTEDS